MPQPPSPAETIAEGEQYALVSYGHGIAHALRYKEENTSAYFEGDENAAFLAEYQSVKDQYPQYGTDQLLAQLWDQGGYSWMAVPDDELTTD